MKLKSQSAMEYLTTYGWAIILLLVSIAALYMLGVFGGGSILSQAGGRPGTCQVVRPNGPGTAQQISLNGECSGLTPQSVLYFGNAGGTATANYIGVSMPSYPTTVSGVNGAQSVIAWVNFPSTGGSQALIITDLYSSTGPTGMEFRICGGCGNLLQLAQDGTGNWVGGVATPSLNTWHQVAYTWNGIWANYYIDGVLKGTSTPSATQSGTPTIFYIGGNPTVTEQYAGWLSNVQLYNTALTANEINKLYIAGIGAAPQELTNLAGWWPLNGNANDYSGNNNNGKTYGQFSFNTTWQSAYTAP